MFVRPCLLNLLVFLMIMAAVGLLPSCVDASSKSRATTKNVTGGRDRKLLNRQEAAAAAAETAAPLDEEETEGDNDGEEENVFLGESSRQRRNGGGGGRGAGFGQQQQHRRHRGSKGARSRINLAQNSSPSSVLKSAEVVRKEGDMTIQDLPWGVLAMVQSKAGFLSSTRLRSSCRYLLQMDYFPYKSFKSMDDMWSKLVYTTTTSSNSTTNRNSTNILGNYVVKRIKAGLFHGAPLGIPGTQEVVNNPKSTIGKMLTALLRIGWTPQVIEYMKLRSQWLISSTIQNTPSSQTSRSTIRQQQYQAEEKIRKMKRFIFNLSARGGNLEVFDWLWEENGGEMRPNSRTLNEAFIGGNREIISILLTAGIIPDVLALASAVEGGHLDIVRWVVQDELVTGDLIKAFKKGVVTAARFGHMHILCFFFEELHIYINDGRLRQEVTTAAAASGKAIALSYVVGRLNLAAPPPAAMAVGILVL